MCHLLHADIGLISVSAVIKNWNIGIVLVRKYSIGRALIWKNRNTYICEHIVCIYTHISFSADFWVTKGKLIGCGGQFSGARRQYPTLSGAADALKLHTRCLQVGLRDGRTGVSRGSFSSHMHSPPTISLRVGTRINPPLFSHGWASTSGGWQFESTARPCTEAKKYIYIYIDHCFRWRANRRSCVHFSVFISGWLSLASTIPISGPHLPLCLARWVTGFHCS